MTSLQERFGVSPAWLLRGKYVAYIVSWVAFGASIFLMLSITPGLLKLLMEVLGINRWARSAVHNFSFFFVGLTGLCMVIIVENYLRTAVQKNLLLRRIAIALGSALILLVASYALHGFLFHLLTT